MDIVFCINNNWTMQCGVTIKSILEFNKNPITFHILSKNISDENKQKLVNIVKLDSNKFIKFYNISSDYDDKFILRPGDRVSIETYFRFFIPVLLEDKIKKVLYLDADIICTNKLDSLFNTDITNYAAGMILDARYCEITKFNRLNYEMKYGYFNAGVMLINLDYWRINDISKKLITYVNDNKELCFSHEQDAINAILHDKILRLSPAFNIQTILLQYYFFKDLRTCPQNIQYEFKYEKKIWPELEEALSLPVLIHFTDFYKPWHKSCKVPFTELWRLFLSQTTWKNYKFSKKIYPKQVHYKNEIKRTIARIKKTKCSFDNFPSEMYQIEKDIVSKLNNKIL